MSSVRDVRRAWLPLAGIVGGTLVGIATAALVRRAWRARDDRWWFLSEGLAVDFEKGGVSVARYATAGRPSAPPAPRGAAQEHEDAGVPSPAPDVPPA